MGQLLFRWRLAVIVGAFGVAAAVTLSLQQLAEKGPLPSALASLADHIGVERAFLITGPLCLIAFLLRFTGEARLGAAVYGQEASARVVTGGPFGLSRHPLYVGTWLFFVAGTAPYLPPLGSALLAVAFGAALASIGAHEERALAAKHGDAWARYAGAVPRLIGVPGAVDDDGIRPTAGDWARALSGNLFFLSLGVYRIGAGLFGASKLLGLINLACLLIWLVVVAVRRLRAR